MAVRRCSPRPCVLSRPLCRARMAMASVALVLSVPVSAHAQTATVGSRLTMQIGESSGSISKDAFGKPCLDIEAASRAHVTNPNVYDHIVSVSNQCVKAIKLRICYVGSERCAKVVVSARRRTDVLLGVYPAMRTFRFSYSEMR